MSTTAMIALSLLLSGVPKADEPKNYGIETAGTTVKVKPGQAGVLKLQIKAAKGYKISAEAPLKIALNAAGLALKKTALGHEDAADKASTSPMFAVDFNADQAGKKTIDADATFFVCNENLCERKNEKLTVAVDVQP